PEFTFANDTLMLISIPGGTMGVPLPDGEPRAIGTHHLFNPPGISTPISPDGKWIASAAGVDRKSQWAVTSTDGDSFRLLGKPFGCDAWAIAWLPDGRSYLGGASEGCLDWREEIYVVPT